MPIYDQGYRHHVARSPLHRVRFWPITREALRLVLARRAFLGLLLASYVTFVVRVLQIYVFTRFPDARLLAVDARLFGDFLNGQIWFALLLCVFGGSGLIANDLRTGAILVYLSRPLTQRDYILGKLGVPLALNLAITLVPALALYVAALGLAPNQFLGWKHAWVPFAVAVHALALSLVIGLLTLAVSSFSRSARVAGLSFVSLFLGLEFVRLVLQSGFNRNEAALLSVLSNLNAVGAALFGAADPLTQLHWIGPLAVLVALSLGCLAVLRARVRAVEIVT